jgi:hypothetical protein
MQWHTVAHLSDHMETTPEGFLLVRDVPIARTGIQMYRFNELPDVKPNADGWIFVDREPSEVFDAVSIASFTGKPITNDHPNDHVTPDNWPELAIGTVQHPRRGSGHNNDVLVADLLFTTNKGIDAVRRGKRALSVGYDAAYEQDAPGTARQRHIIANHVALVDEGRCGERCVILDGMPHFNADWKEAEHPRGQPENAGQFTSGGGGGGKAPERASKGAAFVSPSRADHLDFPQAITGLQSDRQSMLAKASDEIDKALGLKTRSKGAVGAWSDGAENSIMSEVDGGSFDELRVAAAMKAHIAEQKASLVFQDDPKGTAWLHSFQARGSMDEIHAGLLEDGVEFHTVIPTESGATVYVCDLDGGAVDAVAKNAKRHSSPVTSDAGRAEFIGTTKQDGTDAEQRADAQQAYEGIIAGAGVPGADAIWQRIHSTYGKTLHEVGDSWFADIDYDRYETIDWEESKHPRGQPENKGEFAKGGSGGGGGEKPKSYVRAGETGEKTPAEEQQKPGVVSKATRKAISSAKKFGAEDREILHEHFKETNHRDRRAISRYLRSGAKALPALVVSHVKEEIVHAGHAAAALGSVLMGRKPSARQMEGVKSVATRALLTAGAMAVGDPSGGYLTHGVANLASHVGHEVVNHVMIEHALKLFAGGGRALLAGGGALPAGAANAAPEKDAAPPAQPALEDLEGQDDPDQAEGEEDAPQLSDEEMQLIQAFLECLAQSVETLDEATALRILDETADEDEEEGDEEEDDGDSAAEPEPEDDAELEDRTRDVDYPWHDDASGWSEAEHPRVSEGQSTGGEFTKGAGGSAAHMAAIRKGAQGEKKASKEEKAAQRETAKAEKAQAQAAEKERKAGEREAARGQREAAAAAAKEAEKAAKVEAARVPKVPRSKEEPHGISTRLPSKPEQARTSLDAHETAQHLVDYESTLDPEADEWRQKATDLLVGNTKYPAGVDPKTHKPKVQKDYVGMPPGPPGETSKQAAERFIKYATNNILALHDAVPESWRNRASKWYDGASVVAEKWAKDYGKSSAQIAGVIAAQSPKKDWFQNVEVAARMLDYAHNKLDVPFNDAAAAKMQSFIEGRAVEKPRKVAPGEPQPETKKEMFQRILNSWKKPDGSWAKLGEIKDPFERAAWMSMYDQANTDLHYKELSPEGKYGDYVTNKDQEPDDDDEDDGAKKNKKPLKLGDKTVLVWPTMENIAKGLKILEDGSPENISKNLGEAHKVRNFYMNILYPQSKGGHVTIDTHAIAGAFMKPLGQNDDEVGVGLGNKSPSNNTLGLGGTYPFIAEAYRRAAKERGILPRQMQSIAWEGLRGLFSPEAKRDKKLRGDVDDIHREHMTGKITQRQMQDRVMARASPGDEKKGETKGVPRTPKWYARTKDKAAGRLYLILHGAFGRKRIKIL